MTTTGDVHLGRILGTALEVESSLATETTATAGGAASGEIEARRHVHGFHVYPARMHPVTARRLVEGFSPTGGTVLDPFCGSGTVLVEARSAGRRGVGVDLNPLATALALRKVTPAAAPERAALLAAAEVAAAAATARRKARAGASRRYPEEDVATFDPHVLLELDGLRVGIEATADPGTRGDLLLVLSSVLVKLSRRRSDTSGDQTAKRIAAGYPSRLFVNKTRELVEALAEVEPLLAAGPDAQVHEGDARELAGVPPGSVDAVVSSPPYAGVYDYLEHHRLRLRWLGRAERGLARRELGSKRSLADLTPTQAAATYERDLADALTAMHRALRPGGVVVLLVADSAFGRVALRADDVVARAGRRAGLVPVAAASQVRPHFHGATMAAFAGRPRLEHALLLRRPAGVREPARQIESGAGASRGDHR